MAAYDLEEQEQIAEIKAWWKQYGNRLVNVAVAVALVALGWQGWNGYQRYQAAQASAIYGALQQAVQEKDTQRIKAASGELLEKFSGSPYAVLGALISAKAMIEANDAQTAKAQLLWASENAKDELRDLAHLRAAAVLLDDKDYEQALAQLNKGALSPAFEIRFLDMRGDILSAQEKKTDAVSTYRMALTRLDESKHRGAELEWQDETNVIFRRLIEQKIDALGGDQ